MWSGVSNRGLARPLPTQAFGNALINFKGFDIPPSGPHWKQMLSCEGGERGGIDTANAAESKSQIQISRRGEEKRVEGDRITGRKNVPKDLSHFAASLSDR